MAYMEVSGDETPTAKMVRDFLCRGGIPDDWATRCATSEENKLGEWAYIREVIEFPTPPLEEYGPGPVLPRFVDLPPHDPDRYQTTDYLSNPNCTNGMRAGPRNFFSVKVLRVNLEAGFKRLLCC